MAEDVPFSFQPDGWVENQPQFAGLSQDQVWPYLRYKTEALGQAHRGRAFKEKSYVRHVR